LVQILSEPVVLYNLNS